MKYLAIIFILIGFSACSFKEVKPTNYYGLEYENRVEKYKNSNRKIYIDKTSINAPYNSIDIIYSKAPYSFNHYIVNKWIEFPNVLLQNILYETIQNSDIFQQTTTNKREISKNDYILKSKIVKLLHRYKNSSSSAIVQIEVKLLQDNKIVKTILFKDNISCDENTPYGFIKATNISINSIVYGLLEELENIVE